MGREKGMPWGWIAAFAVLLAIGVSADNDTRNASVTASPSAAYSPPSSASGPSSPSIMKLDGREEALYREDPSSMGYTAEDRDFMREHGVTETEMRAAETVLKDKGIE